MLIKSKFYSFMVTFVIMVIIVIFPEISREGVIKGMITSTNVLIPSLYPFMVCVLIIMKSDIKINCRFLNRFIYKLFGQNVEMFVVFLLSLIGGYPIGAKLINELYNKKSINKTSANTMLTFCVNAGPAFIISVVGTAVNSKKLGIVLLIAHILSSIIIALCLSKSLKKEKNSNNYKKIDNKNFSQIFVESIYDATSGIISICGFVIVFSVVNTYLDYWFKDITVLKNISLLTEVTSSVQKCNNVYLISFLLAFSCFSIWFQVIAMVSKLNVNIKQFILGRITHGIISVLISYILINLLNIKVTVYSNNIYSNYKIFYNNVTLFIPMFIMVTILLLFLISKNNSGKITDDML